MKKVAGRLKLDMGQYREVAAFAQFGTSELDKATLAQLERGQRIQEVLKQNQYTPVALDKQVMILYAVISGLLSDIPVDKVTEFEAGLNQFLDANYPDLGKGISSTKELADDTEATLKKAINEFKQGFAK